MVGKFRPWRPLEHFRRPRENVEIVPSDTDGWKKNPANSNSLYLEQNPISTGFDPNFSVIYYQLTGTNFTFPSFKFTPIIGSRHNNFIAKHSVYLMYYTKHSRYLIYITEFNFKTSVNKPQNVRTYLIDVSKSLIFIDEVETTLT